MLEHTATVVENLPVAPACYRLAMYAPEIARMVRPGQFLMIACSPSNCYDPLLRRPMSVYRVRRGAADGEEPSIVEIIYRVKGKGTALLAEMPPGRQFQVLGPLGQGFHVDPQVKHHVLIGAGTGIPALMLVSEEVLRRRLTDSGIDLRVIIGAHSDDEVLCREDWQDVCVANDLCIWITRGELHAELEQLSSDLARLPHANQPAAIYACGPFGFLAAVAHFAEVQGVPCQVSLEEHMACGVGACQNCICRGVSQEGTANENSVYRLVCKDGPVFDSRDIDWHV